MITKEAFIDFLKQSKNRLESNYQVAVEVGCNNTFLNVIDKVSKLISKLESKALEGEIKINYLNEFHQNLANISSHLPYNNIDSRIIQSIKQQSNEWRNQQKTNFESKTVPILNLYEQIEFNIEFFSKIGYFDNNVVAIGANGSGKTTLSNRFKVYLQNNGVVISAQRILLVPKFDSIPNVIKTSQDLKQSQTTDKSNKSQDTFHYLRQEFEVVLQNLLADNQAEVNSYHKAARARGDAGMRIESPGLTNLDKALIIWNSLIEHRTISCDDGINISVNLNNLIVYPAVQMSDGEKVMLYLIAQVLQAPKDGFIIIDEPEMYLHKTILKKLWDILEAERTDCIFIYLTHDLDFATSRTTAKKIWIKSFTHPNKWEIEDIPTDEIPEALLFELLGSRKNILFCEGLKGSIDERIYSMLFPELTIIPVGSCFDVIHHTKTFNKLKNVNTEAFGLVDSDYHDNDRLQKFKDSKIYSFAVAEVENLLLDEELLKILAGQILVEGEKVELIKVDIIGELSRLIELQASNYVSTKTNNYFTDSDISRGNKLEELKNNYDDFIKKASLQEWYDERYKYLEKIINDKDYQGVLMVFNNKGLQKFANKHLNISNFTDRIFKLLQSNSNARSILMKYFPNEIKEAGIKAR